MGVPNQDMTLAVTTDDSEYSLSVDDAVERYAASTRLPRSAHLSHVSVISPCTKPSSQDKRIVCLASPIIKLILPGR
jgi:hypothetical protein